MKKSMMALTAALAVTTLSGQAFAEEGRGYIGVGNYVLTIAEKSGNITKSYNWAGNAVIGGYNYTDKLSVNGSYYSVTEDLDAQSKMEGFDLSVRLGPNGLGFTYYGALGIFSDTWTHPLSVSEDHSGTLIGGGIGYNWENVSFNWDLISFRSAADYQRGSADTTVGTGSMSIAYRF